MNRAQRRSLRLNQLQPGTALEERIALAYVEDQMRKAEASGEPLHLSESEFIVKLKEYHEKHNTKKLVIAS
jgi:hypothetical protein